MIRSVQMGNFEPEFLTNVLIMHENLLLFSQLINNLFSLICCLCTCKWTNLIKWTQTRDRVVTQINTDATVALMYFNGNLATK